MEISKHIVPTYYGKYGSGAEIVNGYNIMFIQMNGWLCILRLFNSISVISR